MAMLVPAARAVAAIPASPLPSYCSSGTEGSNLTPSSRELVSLPHPHSRPRSAAFRAGMRAMEAEDLVCDANGQLLAGSLADYAIPIATDFPRICILTRESSSRRGHQ